MDTKLGSEEFRKFWDKPFVWTEKVIEDMLSKPQSIVELMLILPPDTMVKTKKMVK